MGRAVSLSPLETANAFCKGRGVFAGVGGNAEVKEMVEERRVGGEFRYGVVVETGRLGLEVVDGGDGVRRPVKGEIL